MLPGLPRPPKLRAGPEIDAHFVEEARVGDHLRAAAQIRRAAMHGERLERLLRQRLGENALGRGEVLLHMRRRERLHGADALEAVPLLVLGEPGRIGDVVMDAEQIVNRVGVLVARQLVQRHALALRQARGFAFLQLAGEPLDDLRRLGGRRLLLLLRRHFARADAVHHIGPMRRRAAAEEIARERIDAKLALLFLLAVAADAMLVEERLDGFREVGIGFRRLRGGEPGSGQKEDGEMEGGVSREERRGPMGIRGGAKYCTFPFAPVISAVRPCHAPAARAGWPFSQ